MISYGDDNVLNISSDVIEQFNQTSITSAFAEVGMTYTAEDKSSIVTPYRNLSEVTFLKRSFRYMNDTPLWVAPLDLDVCTEIPLWIRTELDVERQVMDNVETALREISLHGDEVYTTWKNVITQNIRGKFSSFPYTPNWSVMFADVTGIKPGVGHNEITVIRVQQSLNPGAISSRDDNAEDVFGRIGQCVPPKIKAIDPVCGPHWMMYQGEDMTTNIATKQGTTTSVTSESDTQGTDGGRIESVVPTHGTETTSYTADQPHQTRGTVRPTTLSKPFCDTQQHDLMDILQRPYHCGSWSWRASDGNGVELALVNLNETWKSNTNVWSKVDKFGFVKWSFRVRFLINAQSFQLGKLLISAYPRYENETVPFSGLDQHQLYEASTARHVELDAGTGEEVAMDLEYFGFADTWRSNIALPTWMVTIKVLNPLKGSSTNEEVDVTMFLEAYDIELNMPHGQSNEQELKSKKGVVTSTLETVSEVAGVLTRVPIISEIAGTVSWVAGALSGISSYFGFSKPLNINIVERFQQNPALGFTNTDGVDNSVSMSFSPNNIVEQESNRDEMVINEITKLEGLLTQQEWHFADAVGSVLFEYPKEFRVIGGHVTSSTPLAYVANLFLFWRGPITFRFSFAKNRFYSGKLAVTFNPHVTTTPAINQDNNLYRKIITVKDSNDFSFTVPYVSDQQWRKMTESTGLITVRVLNRLVAAETVPQSIEMNVWASSSAIEFAVPNPDIKRAYRAYQTTVPKRQGQSIWPNVETHVVNVANRALASDSVADNLFEVPHNRGDRTYQAITPHRQGQMNIQAAANMGVGIQDNLFEMAGENLPSRGTMGEVIVNLRPLTRRFTYLKKQFGNFALSSWPVRVESDPTILVPGMELYTNVFDYLAQSYRFVSGSMRVKEWTYGGKYGIVVQLRPGADPLAEGIAYDVTNSVNALRHIQPLDINPVVEAQLPFYCPFPRRFTAVSPLTWEPAHVVYNHVVVDADGAEDITAQRDFYLAGGDDFNFSKFMFAPCLIKSIDASPIIFSESTR